MWSTAMESWVLEGDSYSFLCGSPNNYNLQHLDGPNHVEIFDITAIPSTRSAISETTCLCDIFGDDCESPLLSSSPTSASLLKKDVNEQLPLDFSDSSGSYHTAHDSDRVSDGSDIFDDSKDTVQKEVSQSCPPATNLIVPFEKIDGTLLNVSHGPNNENKSDLPKIKDLPEPSSPKNSSSLQVEITHTSDQKPETPLSDIAFVTFQTTPTKLHCKELPPAGIQQDSELPQNGNYLVCQQPTFDITSGTVSDIKVNDIDMQLTKDQQEVYSSQNDCTVQKEKLYSSDEQLLTPGSEFSNSIIRATGSTLDLITPEFLSEDKDISEQIFTVSCELKETTNENQLPKSSSPLNHSNLPIKDTEVILDNGSPTSAYIDNSHLSPQIGTQQAIYVSQDSCPVLVEDSYIYNLQQVTSTSDVFYENSSPTHGSVLLLEQQPQLPWNGVQERIGNADLFDQQLFESTDMTHDNDTTTTVKINDDTQLNTFDCSLITASSTEPSIIIHSPVGFTISPSPEQKKRIYSAESESFQYTPDVQETPTTYFNSCDPDMHLTSEFSSTNCIPEREENVIANESDILDNGLLEQRQEGSHLPWNSIQEQTENVDSFDQQLLQSTSDMSSGNGTITEVKVNNGAMLQTEDLQESYCSQENFPVETEHPTIRATNLTHSMINSDYLAENKHMAEQTDTTLPEPSRSDSEESLTENLLQEIKAPLISPVIILSESWEANSAEETIAPAILLENRDTKQSNITLSELNETHSEQEDTHESTALYEITDFSHRIIPPNTLLEINDLAEQNDAVFSKQFENDPVQGVAPLTEHDDYILSEHEEMDLIQQNVQPEKQCSDNHEHIIKLFETHEKNPSSTLPEEEMANSDCSVDTTNVLPEDSNCTCLQTCISTSDTNKELPFLLINKNIPSNSEHIDEPFNILTTFKNDNESYFNVSNSTFSPEITVDDSTKSNVTLVPSGFTFCAKTNKEHKRLSPISSNVTEGLISPEIDEVCSFSGSLISASSTEPSVTEHSPVGFMINPSPEQNMKIYSAEPKSFQYTPDVQETATTYLNSCDSDMHLTSEFSTMNCLPESEQNVVTNEYVLIPELEFATSSLDICNVQSQNLVKAQNGGTDQKDIFYRTNSPQNNLQAQELDDKQTAESSTSTAVSSIGFNNMASLPISTLSRPSSSSLDSPRNICSPDVDVGKCDEIWTLTTNEIADLAMSEISNQSLTKDGIAGLCETSSSPLDIVYLDVEGTVLTEISTSVTLDNSEITKQSLSSLLKPSSSLEEISRPLSTLSLPKYIVPSAVEIICPKETKNWTNSTALQSSTSYEPELNPEPFKDGQRNTDSQLLTTFNKKMDLGVSAQGYGEQFENSRINKDQFQSRRPALDEIMDIASKMSTIQEKTHLLPESYYTGVSITEIDQHQNDTSLHVIEQTNSNSPKPRKTPKTKTPVPNTNEKDVDLEANGTVGRKETSKRQSAYSQRKICQKGMQPGENTNVQHSNNDSKYEGQSSSNKGRSRNWVRQNELTSLKGVENIEGSNRGKQVELSVSARNRSGLTNLSPALSSRDPKSEIPVCYFESPLATRQQPTTILSAQSLQEERKSGARTIKSTSQNNYIGTGNLSSECVSEAFSMGSEFDETDSEVKWFTDQAYSSLSSSQGDYLDIYNSSHGSSANISQQSTMDSPRASTWISCADLYDTALHNNNNTMLDSFLPDCTSDSSKCFEMDNFECVDIAVESKEEVRRGKRTVPKRQIQFKRLDFNQLKPAEDAENVLELPYTQDCSRDSFSSQQSCASLVQEDLKTLPLNKITTQAKTASTIIKSVLSKKMDNSIKESTRSENFTPDDKHQHETLTSGEPEKQSLNPVIQSESGLLSEGNSDKESKSPYSQKKTYRPKVPPKPLFRMGSRPLPPNSNFQGKIEVGSEIKPIMYDPFVRKTPKKQFFENSKKKANDMGESDSSDSACGIVKYANPTDTRGASMQRRITNRDTKQPVTPELSRTFLSKTSEINLKPCTIKDKDTKSSQQLSRSSDMKLSKGPKCEPQEVKPPAKQMQFKTPVEIEDNDGSDKDKTKSVIHKVRDVRKLVKNTYNLSFTASNAIQHEDLFDKGNKDMQPHPQRLQIECKAISWKDKQNTCREIANILDETSTKVLKTNSEMIPLQENTSVQISEKENYESELFNNMCEQDTKLEMPPRPSSKEVSMLLYVKEDTPTGQPKTVSSSHSVSMLLKEKGMQADIGVCDVLNEEAGAKTKHVNKIEVPLQMYGSEVTTYDSLKNKKEEVPGEQNIFCDRTQPTSENATVVSSLKSEETEDVNKQELSLQSKEHVLILTTKDPTPLTSVNKAEVRTFSSTTKSHAKPVTTSKEIELPIQVRSIASDRPKPSVLPKPNFKQPFAEIRSTSNDLPETYIKPATTILKQQTHLSIDKINTSTTLLHGKPSSEAAKPIPSNTKILAVSAVSSQKTEATQSSVQSPTSLRRHDVSITSVQNTCSKNLVKEHVKPVSSSAYNQSTGMPAESQATLTQPAMAVTSKSLLQTKDFHFPASDDPPSYDERESFSPLLLSDLPAKRLNRYHPTTRHTHCSCASCSHPNYSQPYHGLQNQTPTAPHSPGQTLSYPGSLPQAQVRPHQCKPDGHGLNCTSVSPTLTAPQVPAMIQPLQRARTYLAAPIQPYSNDQQQPSAQQMDRRPGCQHSPQPPSGPPYVEHSHSPNIATLDPRSQFFNSQEVPPGFSHDFGSEGPGNGGMVYPENSLGFGQGSRRVLLDPETGKYFYIEVPMQPLRKMLFDPEIGQYVEVVIPQQTMSNSSMYPPAAAPYPSIGGPGLYTSQYLPYAVPPHSQSAQQPRHPEHSVPTSLQQASMGYGNSAGQKRKSDVKGHPSLDQGYLESMYYISSDLNANANSTPSDCYHKPSSNMPTGGRR